MRWSSLATPLALLLLPAAAAADATSPIDATQRNRTFTPGTSQRPEAKTLPQAGSVQEKRVDKTTVEKPSAAVGERRAAIEVVSAQEKTLLEKDSRRPEAVDRALSDFNQRAASITTAADANKPPLVAKYQDSMTAASAASTAPFAALSGTSRAKINRFVFRKNGATSGDSRSDAPARALGDAPVTPAAGGSAIRK